MTATELHEALQGVPDEALCDSLEYATIYADLRETWWLKTIPTGKYAFVCAPDHAAALQRDAMTEWLWANDTDVWGRVSKHNGWSVRIDKDAHCDGGWMFCDTRLHALAAACKYVHDHR